MQGIQHFNFLLPNIDLVTFVTQNSIQFGALLTQDIEKSAEFKVTSQDLIQQPMRIPAPDGCLDPRLGISDKRSICQTCHKVNGRSLSSKFST